ncbi:hypothetical protein J6590_001900 [Homalodisca vitripennis]|nr:hypothetical protein J6590_001900 [Homalodisca vitripennis]
MDFEQTEDVLRKLWEAEGRCGDSAGRAERPGRAPRDGIASAETHLIRIRARAVYCYRTGRSALRNAGYRTVTAARDGVPTSRDANHSIRCRDIFRLRAKSGSEGVNYNVRLLRAASNELITCHEVLLRWRF